MAARKYQKILNGILPAAAQLVAFDGGNALAKLDGNIGMGSGAITDTLLVELNRRRRASFEAGEPSRTTKTVLTSV